MITVYEKRGFKLGFEKGFKIGLERGRRLAAKSLLADGISVKEVSRQTQLTIKVVRALACLD